MPAKLERCVEALIKNRKFKPGMKPEKRKSSAYAICTASTKAKNCDFEDIILNLPEYINCDLNEEGHVVLSEVEGFNFDDYDKANIVELSEDSEECNQLHFSEDENDFFSSFVKFADKNDKKDDEQTEELKKFEMLRGGTFKHPWMDEVIIDRKLLTTLTQNFLNNIIDREIALDTNHNSDVGAFGWLRSLNMGRRKFKNGKVKDVLIGNWKMTAEGQKLLDEEKYKYFSIEYTFNYVDKETEKEYGPAIQGGALTNRPFIPGMKAVTMSEDSSNIQSGEPTTKDMKAAITTSEPCDETSVNQKEVHPDEATLTEEQTNNKNTENISTNAAEKKSRPRDGRLPDPSFALIKRDASGKIVKRSLPHHGPSVESPSENSSVDLGRLRNALARVNQVTGFTSEEVARAERHLQAHVKNLSPTRKASEGEKKMNIESRIAELQDKLDALEDPKSTEGQRLSDEIGYLNTLKAQMDSEKKETENKFSEQMNAQLADRDAKLSEFMTNQKKMADELAKFQEKNRKLEIEKYCDSLVTAGQAPAVVKSVRNVLMGETKGAEHIVQFSEKDQNGVEIKHAYDLRGALEYVLASTPKVPGSDSSVRHSDADDKTPDETAKNSSMVKTIEGTEVNLFDEEAIARRASKIGYGKKNAEN